MPTERKRHTDRVLLGSATGRGERSSASSFAGKQVADAHATKVHRVLMVHNRYQEAGGEDRVFAGEVALLRSFGCAVETLEVSNDSIKGGIAKLSTALGVISSSYGYRLMSEALVRARPDIVHVHNFFPRLSPAIFDACADASVPAVWTLHNFRVVCANGLLFRDGKPCEDCVGNAPLPAIMHSCYRGSRFGSAAVAAMIAYHNVRGTWKRKVERFITLNDSAREIVVRAGLPAERVVVKPNFVLDPLTRLGSVSAAREGALFVGRLSPEKGVSVLLDAWRNLPQVPLTIVGDGPERQALENVAPANVRFSGFLPQDEVLRAMADAQAVIVPSIWYETFGLVAAEAMAIGTPVIASRIGALAGMINDGVDGLHFRAGDADDLASVVASAFSEPAQLSRLGIAARESWRSTMHPDANLVRLLAIYDQAMAA